MIWDCGRGLGMYHDGGLYPRVPKKEAELKFLSGGSFGENLLKTEHPSKMTCHRSFEECCWEGNGSGPP